MKFQVLYVQLLLNHFDLNGNYTLNTISYCEVMRLCQTTGSFDTSFIMMIVALIVAAGIALTINEKPKKDTEDTTIGEHKEVVAL